MYKILNTRTNRHTKNAITGKPLVFNAKADAEKFADSMRVNSFSNGTAFNNVRPSNYTVVTA